MIRERLFVPAQLTATRPNSKQTIIPNRAHQLSSTSLNTIGLSELEVHINREAPRSGQARIEQSPRGSGWPDLVDRLITLSVEELQPQEWNSSVCVWRHRRAVSECR